MEEEIFLKEDDDESDQGVDKGSENTKKPLKTPSVSSNTAKKY